MTYRIPTVPLRGGRPKLSPAAVARLLELHANRSRRRKGVDQWATWAAELGAHKDTLRRYIDGRVKFPVREKQC
jgi:hypothetical protein